jgi:ubiquinone/menaquinone biosynthesis C-methylase UbiE
VKAYYHARASEYDDWWLGRGFFADRVRPGWDDELATLALALRNLPAARTLDIACGTGFLTRHLPGEVTGLDQSHAMLELARRQAPRAGFVRSDALELPFAPRSFERVFTSFFYCHLVETERLRFLAEVRRVAPEIVVLGSRPRGTEPRALGGACARRRLALERLQARVREGRALRRARGRAPRPRGPVVRGRLRLIPP